MKRVFHYLRGTSDASLIYGIDIKCLVFGYSTFDYVGDVGSKRSMACYVFTLGVSIASWKVTLTTYSYFVYY